MQKMRSIYISCWWYTVIMFVFSCKYVPNSPVRDTVDAILKYHPDEKITIVDSDSDDKSYYDFFSDYDNIDICSNNIAFIRTLS